MKSFFLCLCAPKNYHLADLQNRTIIPRFVSALVLSCHSSFMIFIKITIIYYLLLFVNKYQNFTKQKVFFQPNSFSKHETQGTRQERIFLFSNGIYLCHITKVFLWAYYKAHYEVQSSPFIYQYYHWFMLFTFGLYILNVHWSRNTDGFQTIFTFEIRIIR